MSDDVNIQEEVAGEVGLVRQIIRAVVVIVVMIAGFSVMKFLMDLKPEPAKIPSKDTSPIVKTIRGEVSRQQIAVVASGTVMPARQVVIAAEVGGRVTWINPEVEPGGRFKTGASLLKVDARDYQLAVEQQAAQVTLARTQLEVEKSRRRVAEKEWEAFGEKPAEGSVAARDPQIKAAEGAVKAAESGLRRTRLAVSKAGMIAPFNAMVLERRVDLGQLVVPGTPLATLVGTDQFWVQVSIPYERLAWIDVPGVAGVGPTGGSKVTVEQRVGDQRIVRNGRVVRLAGDVDPIGRMAKLLVEIDDPLGLSTRPAAGEAPLPLLLNSYVEVSIGGREVEDVVELPRIALRGDDSVWTVVDEKLAFVKVDVVWRRRDTVLVRGLPAGAEIIISPVPGPIDGMKVRRPSAGKPADAAPAAPAPAERGPHSAAPAGDAGVATP